MQRVEAQLDAVEGIKTESIDPLIHWQGLMGLRRHATTREQQVALLQQALKEAERLPRALANNETVFGPDSKQVGLVTGEWCAARAAFVQALQSNQGNRQTLERAGCSGMIRGKDPLPQGERLSEQRLGLGKFLLMSKSLRRARQAGGSLAIPQLQLIDDFERPAPVAFGLNEVVVVKRLVERSNLVVPFETLRTGYRLVLGLRAGRPNQKGCKQ
jgi:hypothetical protein